MELSPSSGSPAPLGLFAYGSFVRAASPDGGIDVAGLDLVVLDVETTGFSPAHGDRIVEVGAVRRSARNGEPDRELVTLVDPGRDVGPTFVHGITGAEVDGAPVFAEVAGSLLALMSGAVVVGHNLPFDERFLAWELARAGIAVPTLPALCTFRLARRIANRGIANHKLATCCDHYGIPTDAQHSALGDARMTALLAGALLHGAAAASGHVRLTHAPVELGDTIAAHGLRTTCARKLREGAPAYAGMDGAGSGR